MNNVILIGLPAAGKSTLGVLLAKERGMDYCDADLVMQRREGMRLCDIMAAAGPDGFVQKEQDTLLSLTLRHTVLATGGSAVYSPKAMQRLKEQGVCVYLQLPFGEWRRRLGNIRRRGVVLREGMTLQDLYTERTALYQRYADLTLHMGRESIETTVDRLLRLLPADL